MSYKTEQQMEFEHNIQTLGQQFQIYENPSSSAKLNQDKINYFAGKVKQLNSVFNRMEQRMKSNMRNKNYNEFDIKNKLRKHLQNFQKIKERYRKLQDKVVATQKADLMANRNLNSQQIDDFKRQADMLDRARNLNKDAQQVHTITKDTLGQLEGQGRKLKQIHEDAAEFQHQLTMSDQLLRVIANRELVTKLILVLLVFFLGLADILILFIKLLGK